MVSIGEPVDQFTALIPAAPPIGSSLHEYESSSTLRKGSYSLYVYNVEANTMFDISEYVINISYSGDENSGFNTISAVVQNAVIIRPLLRPPNWIVLEGPYWPSRIEYTDVQPREDFREDPSMFGRIEQRSGGSKREIDRGMIVDVTYNQGDNKTITLLCKDPTWLLVKNSLQVRFPQGTLTNRLEYLETSGHILLPDDIIRTEHEIKSSRGGETSLYNDIIYDINETNRVEGTRYRLRHRAGKHFLHDDTDQDLLWGFVYGKNIMGLSVKESIEGYYNQVYVTSSSSKTGVLNDLFDGSPYFNNYTGVANNPADWPTYGLHSTTQRAEQNRYTPNEQLQAFKFLERTNKPESTARVETFAMPGILVGDGVLIYEPVTGLAGIYYVRAFNCDIQADIATMRLDVQFDRLSDDRVRREIENDSIFGQLLSENFATTGSEDGPATITEHVHTFVNEGLDAGGNFLESIGDFFFSGFR